MLPEALQLLRYLYRYINQLANRTFCPIHRYCPTTPLDQSGSTLSSGLKQMRARPSIQIYEIALLTLVINCC